MAHEVETMAYAGDVPWHGLGRKVLPDMTPDEMLIAAGLDWLVEKRPMIVADDENPDPKTFRLVRINKAGKNDVLSYCGTSYEPVQNVDALRVFKKYIEAGNMTMETAGSLRGGKFIWALAKTKDNFTLPGGDKIQGYMLLISPHEFGFSLMAKFTPTRVVCQNTMSYAISQAALTGTFKMRHSRQFDDLAVAEMEEVLGLTNKTMAKYAEQAEFLSTVPFNEEQTIIYLASVFNPGILTGQAIPKTFAQVLANEDISKKNPLTKVINFYGTDPGASLKSSKGTAWGCLNLVTWFLDHKHGRSNDNRMWNGAIGAGVNIKNKALDLALQMAKAA